METLENGFKNRVFLGYTGNLIFFSYISTAQCLAKPILHLLAFISPREHGAKNFRQSWTAHRAQAVGEAETLFFLIYKIETF